MVAPSDMCVPMRRVEAEKGVFYDVALPVLRDVADDAAAVHADPLARGRFEARRALYFDGILDHPD